MKQQARRLAVVFPLIVASASAQAQTNLAVLGDGDCPSPEAVSQALWAIRPDREWPAPTATIRVVEDRVQVSLGEDRERWRDVPAPANCAERARRAAFLIAVWSGELPARTTGAPSLSAVVPAPLPAPAAVAKRPAMVTELGLAGFYSTVGGWVPGGRLEVGRLRRDGWWGVRATAAYQSAKSLYLDIGKSWYDRTGLAAALVLRRDRPRLFLSSDWGLVGAIIRAHGDGYSRNESASGLNVGLAADGRVGLRLGTFRVWAQGALFRWARKETIRVDPLSTGSSSASTLPAWDAHLGLGAGVVLE